LRHHAISTATLNRSLNGVSRTRASNSSFRSIPATFLLSPSKGKDRAFANNGPTQYADATYREVTNLF